MGADPGALVRKRVLHDLDDDLLARLQELVDRRRAVVVHRVLPPLPPLPPIIARLVDLQLVHRLHVGRHIAHIEEGVALQPHVHERGLHAGQHPRHPALVDVAYQTPVPVPLDEDLRQPVVFQHRDPRLVRIALDQHLAGQGRSLPFNGSHTVAGRPPA
jgi:hypothetical protein